MAKGKAKPKDTRMLTTIRVDREQWSEIRKAAYDEHLSVAEFVVRVCLEYIGKEKR